MRCAAATDRRVLPMPGGPVSVIRRTLGSARCAAMAASSAVRPIRLVGGSGSHVGARGVVRRVDTARRRSAGSDVEEDAESVEREAHAALDGAQWQLQHGGDFGLGEAVEVRQLDYFALLAGKLQERSAHPAL